MDASMAALIEMLGDLLPEGDLGKAVALGIAALFLLILAGRIRLEWLSALRKPIRVLWIRARCWVGAHYWKTLSWRLAKEDSCSGTDDYCHAVIEFCAVARCGRTIRYCQHCGTKTETPPLFDHPDVVG